MNRGAKIGLILGGVVVAGLTTFLLVKRKKDKDAEEKQRKEDEQEAQELALKEVKATEIKGGSNEGKNKGYIVPKINFADQLSNPFKELKGKMLKAKKGGANIRNTKAVDNSFPTNLLKKIGSGSSVGTVLSEGYDDMQPKNRWFWVKLKTPCCGTFTNYTKAWVRADVVTFNKYKGKSSAEGDMDGMIEKYDTSYQLGAQVFPHSTWENPLNQAFSGMEGREFEPSGVLNDL